MAERFGEVSTFRGAQLEPDVFDPLIAGNVNRAGLLHLSIDGEEEALESGELFLNQNMHVMASLEFVRYVFSAAANLYDSRTVRIERNNASIQMDLDSVSCTMNDEKQELVDAPRQYNGKVYIGLEDFCKLIGYGFEYDATTTTVSLTSRGAEVPELRERYDLREHGRVSAIRNQGSLSACWAYAAVSALESSLLPEQNVTLSPDLLANHNTYGITSEDPGTYMVAVSTMLSWQAPIRENETEAALHLQEVHFYTGEDRDAVKWAVFRDGGVSTSLYADVDTSNLSQSHYYNGKTDSYYYDGDKAPNHDVVIIGWDDHYDASNFAMEVPGDGAYICQNSWGSEFGDNGVFYVSYYDTNIATKAVSYVKAESTTNYDRIYQSDLLGQVGNIGYNTETAMAANVYTAKSDETLRAVGLYATGADTSYRIYCVEHFADTTSLSDRTLLASGTLDDAGYYTIPIVDTVKLSQGDTFAIIIMLTTPGQTHPIAVEYQNSSLSENADITDGMGYISRNGLNWTRVETEYDSNLCLKAYTTIVTNDTEGATE